MRWLILFCLMLSPALAQPVREVDLELFLAVDVSRSMSPAELEIQRRGYAEALRSPEVYAAVSDGMIGQIALTYVEWAGVDSQRVIIPWTLIDSPETMREAAGRILVHFDGGLRRTSISGALDYATKSLSTNYYNGLRRVIDVSGDGPNNMGPFVTLARDRTLAEGITINGLPLMTTDALSSRWGIEDLDVYYRECVIGGPGAFVLPVFDWVDFPAAIKRKLVLEISGLPDPGPRLRRVNGYDCGIGEKIWQRNRMLFSEP